MTSRSATDANLITRVNMGDSLTRTASRFPDKPALVDGDRALTYRQLNERVNQVANSLASQGYARGDALALAAGNCLEFMVVYYACAKLGVVCVPLNLGWRSAEAGHVLRHSESRGIVAESDLLETLAPALLESPAVADIITIGDDDATVAPGLEGRVWSRLTSLYDGPDTEPEHFVDDRDPMCYLYTSGTTSFPKGVVASHTATYLHALTVLVETGMSADDKVLALMPLFHAAQLNGFTTPALAVGATVHLQRGFAPQLVLDAIEDHRITVIFLLPMMYQQALLDPRIESRDFSSLRKCAYAMTPMPDNLLRQSIEVFESEFYLCFGQTEVAGVSTIFQPEHQFTHMGAVGTQVVNMQVAIMGPDGELLPRGAEGEIVYRGPHLLTEYLKDPQATADSREHGWHHSGDVGRLDPDGMLWFGDRFKDVIKTGGENVASIEVEKAIYSTAHGVEEVVVVGLPHPRWAEAITAVVTTKDGEQITEGEVLAGMRGAISSFKVPKAVIVVDELPRTSTGKIQKNVLRDRYADYFHLAD